MMQFSTIDSYATSHNSRFNNTESNIVSIKKRWDDSYSSLSRVQQRVVDHALRSALNEFARRNPSITTFADVQKSLVRAEKGIMSSIKIDTTMQRLLDINWVIHLINKFKVTNVLAVNAYQPSLDTEEYIAWDGQHTVMILWLLATQHFGENIDNVIVPLCVSQSTSKPDMRDALTTLNSNEGKKTFDAFDLFEQKVYGVRADGSDRPTWKEADDKQRVIEEHGLFLTSKKYSNHTNPGAISRMQEVNKLSVPTLGHLCDYLVYVGAQNRPVEEKELVMMAYFFNSCKLATDVTVTDQMIRDIANVSMTYWNNDFTPTSIFWAKVGIAYTNWYKKAINPEGKPDLKKEAVHGYPFLVKQLEKYLPTYQFPGTRSNSEFVPDELDLF